MDERKVGFGCCYYESLLEEVLIPPECLVWRKWEIMHPKASLTSDYERICNSWSQSNDRHAHHDTLEESSTGYMQFNLGK